MKLGLHRKEREAPVDETVQLVAFSVGEGQYAVDIMRMKEIVNPVSVIAVPKAPPFVEGVIELRGALLPLLDLRKRFDLPATALCRANKFLIVSVDIGSRRMIVGLIVDSVAEPLRVARSEIRPAPPLAVGESSYFVGVVKSPRSYRPYMIVDLDALLSSREKVSLAGIDPASESDPKGGLP